MAHRVAELIQRADSATDPAVKEVAEQECQDLIIRLWETRDNWPSGGPLHTLLPTLKLLLADDPSYASFIRRGKQDDAGGLITCLLKLHREELQLVYQLVKDQMPTGVLESMQKLLDEQGSILSESEYDLISFAIDPSKFPTFDNEEDADGSDEDSVEEVDRISSEESTVTPDNAYSKFIESIESKREEFYKNLGRLLKIDSSSTPD
ncbi:hypothetical protein D770_16820 [Flammeovirgaceae bacterium 311]|nr:hypothetical protein D770_16820 [Flammeovirgaceae bacterium 311]